MINEPSTLAPPSPFQDLRKQTRKLERILFVLIGIIALLPTSVFFVLGIRQLQANANLAAEHISFMLASIHAVNPERPRLPKILEAEMRLTGIASLQLTGTRDRTMLSLGHAAKSVIPVRAQSNLAPALLPFQTIAIEMDSNPLLFQSSRIFAIHLLVAAILMLLIHRFSIPALDKAIAQLETTQAQLIHSEKMSAIGEIYAGLTHEINNPLGVMIGKLELLVKSARARQLSPELTRDLEIINRNGLRIAELIRSLLIFSRKNTFNLSATALNHTIGEVLELVDKPFAKQAIRIETHFDPKLPHCHGSPGHLQQVFLNLLNNARDAMPNGGKITLRTYGKNHSVAAEVEDTGTGITPENRKRLFEPFFTTKGLGKGTGLGLSIAYGIIKTHGGDIEVESTPGKGTLFRVILPAEGRG
ncbi:MAG: sensor histidine kinase [Alphaproteobacteria bacterium]